MNSDESHAETAVDSEAQSVSTNTNGTAEAARPIPPSDRIVPIDVLRGFALLGILIVNVQSFGLIGAAYNNPSIVGDTTGISYFLWCFTYLFFDSKMMAIFSMLFGAGVVLMNERSESRAGSPYWLHAKRMFWLIVLGILHAHLIWFGDILYTYGMCGLVVYFFRRWQPRTLLVVGLLTISIGSAAMYGFDVMLNYMNADQLAEMNEGWAPSQDKIDQELAIYRGGWLTQMPYRSMTALMFETFLFAVMFSWRAGGMMLLGMAFYKWNLITGRRSDTFYLRGALIGIPIGLLLTYAGVVWFEQGNWELKSSMFEATQFNYWGSLATATGYACFVMLACSRNWLPRLQHALACAGRMALTLYLMQSLVMTLIFYGHGLGLFGYVERPGLIGLVVLVWMVQLILAPWWLARFRYGPMEWLWRSLSYWKRQPMALR